jgi:hypothetical protein
MPKFRRRFTLKFRTRHLSGEPIALAGIFAISMPVLPLAGKSARESKDSPTVAESAVQSTARIAGGEIHWAFFVRA